MLVWPGGDDGIEVEHLPGIFCVVGCPPRKIVAVGVAVFRDIGLVGLHLFERGG